MFDQLISNLKPNKILLKNGKHIEDKVEKWYKDDLLHRDEKDEDGFTLPAVINKYGDKEWYQNGKKYRDDRDKDGLLLPTEIDRFGTKTWHDIDGNEHRDEKDPITNLTLSSMIWKTGKRWCQHGKEHNADRDPITQLTLSSYESSCETRWKQNGEFHNLDRDPVTHLTLPAWIDRDAGFKAWFKNGKHHNSDRDPITNLTLPAKVWDDGSKHWYIDGEPKRYDNPELPIKICWYTSYLWVRWSDNRHAKICLKIEKQISHLIDSF